MSAAARATADRIAGTSRTELVRRMEEARRVIEALEVACLAVLDRVNDQLIDQPLLLTLD